MTKICVEETESETSYYSESSSDNSSTEILEDSQSEMKLKRQNAMIINDRDYRLNDSGDSERKRVRSTFIRKPAGYKNVNTSSVQIHESLSDDESNDIFEFETLPDRPFIFFMMCLLVSIVTIISIRHSILDYIENYIQNDITSVYDMSIKEWICT